MMSPRIAKSGSPLACGADVSGAAKAWFSSRGQAARRVVAGLEGHEERLDAARRARLGARWRGSRRRGPRARRWRWRCAPRAPTKRSPSRVSTTRTPASRSLRGEAARDVEHEVLLEQAARAPWRRGRRRRGRRRSPPCRSARGAASRGAGGAEEAAPHSGARPAQQREPRQAAPSPRLSRHPPAEPEVAGGYQSLRRAPAGGGRGRVRIVRGVARGPSPRCLGALALALASLPAGPRARRRRRRSRPSRGPGSRARRAARRARGRSSSSTFRAVGWRPSGAAHSFDLGELAAAPAVEFRLGRTGATVASSERFLTPPGRPFTDPRGSLREDIVVFALAAPPRGAREPRPRRARRSERGRARAHPRGAGDGAPGRGRPVRPAGRAWPRRGSRWIST